MALTRTFTAAKLEPAYAFDAHTEATVLIPSIAYAKGTILGQVTSAGATQGMYKAYTSGASDGSQIPSRILQYDTKTDADGNHVLSLTAAAFEYGGTEEHTSAYIKGTFRTQDLVQSGAGAIDANAVTKLGRLLDGSITSGLLTLS